MSLHYTRHGGERIRKLVAIGHPGLRHVRLSASATANHRCDIANYFVGA
jgi:hypothetical protein